MDKFWLIGCYRAHFKSCFGIFGSDLSSVLGNIRVVNQGKKSISHHLHFYFFSSFSKPRDGEELNWPASWYIFHGYCSETHHHQTEIQPSLALWEGTYLIHICWVVQASCATRKGLGRGAEVAALRADYAITYISMWITREVWLQQRIECRG